MPNTPDLDEFEGPPTAKKADNASPLPLNEPQTQPVNQQKMALRRSLSELEGAFQYMGTAHPDYENTRERIAELKALLDEMPK